jgi:hypothetical protein
MFTFKRSQWGAVAVLAALGFWLVQALAEVQVGRDFQANEPLETIRLELVVGPGGEDLDEPIALDLGLGFPLWLHRLGRVETTAAPFGAVSQRGTAAHAIRAGERATFEFSTTASGELDDLRTTPQLLAGVRVSDISRVGFTSRADHGWIIAGYTIQINGKPFLSNSAVNVNGRGRQDEARERLTELNRDVGPQQTEMADLQALVAAGLATDADRARLGELERTLSPQLAEQRRLERQLLGAAPFFTESGFQPDWRTNGAIEKVKVTVVTAPHTGSETRNYVYFRTGGHKYLLGLPTNPLSPDRGPQEFELDLTTAPLTASDLRGYALGMLAHHEPYGDAPDRWHPQRLLVEVDGRIVYDSEENAIDRASLAAIRIVPPAHVNGAGQVVTNTPVAREAFVWEAGSGAGLDLVNGGTEALPAEDDPTYPAAEPGLNVEQNVTVVEQEAEAWYDPLADPFPGECGFGPEWEPGGGGWDGGGYWPPGWGPPGWDPGWGPGWTPGPGWLDLLMYGLLEEFGLLPEWVIPDPVGEPPQVENVVINWSTFNVEWTVVGDAGQIDHFVVEVVRVRPDLDVPLGEALSEPAVVAADQRSFPFGSLVVLPVADTEEVRSRSYWAVRVAIVPTDPAIGVDPAYSSARPLNDADHSIDLVPTFRYDAGGPLEDRPLSPIGEPEFPGPAAWQAGQTDTHNGIVFSGAGDQYHVAARAENDAEHLTVFFNGNLHPGRYRLIAYLGFRGAVEQTTTVTVGASCRMWDPADPPHWIGYPAAAVLTADPAAAPLPLQPLIMDIDTAHIGPGNMDFQVSYRFSYANIDPNHPPVLIGVRLLDVP